MAWARFDDRFHDNPKVLGLWMTCPEALGLYVMSVTYCSQHETDGLVHDWWLQTREPSKPKRGRLTSALVNAGLFSEHSAGFLINDYLEFNPSREQLEAKREAQKQRRLRAKEHPRASSVPARAQHATAAVIDPDPTRPDPTRGSREETSPPISPLGVAGVQHREVGQKGFIRVIYGGAA